MRILVIDDKEYNRASALVTLEGHDVVAVGDVSEAFKILDGRQQFDAVLTDLSMPAGGFRGAVSASTISPQQELPAGLVFALKASNRGIRVVICADGNHSTDLLCSLLDLLTDKYGVGGIISDHAKRVAFVELETVPMLARWNEQDKVIVPDEDCWKNGRPQIKNWHEAMVESGLFPDLEAVTV